jgi:hypothetical protein
MHGDCFANTDPDCRFALGALLLRFRKLEYYVTDDEKKMRDLAYPLIEPPYERQRWYSVLNEYGLSGFVVLGSTGECVHLDDGESEHLEIPRKTETFPGGG